MRYTIALTLVAAVGVSAVIFAQGRIKQHGRAIVEYRSEEVAAVASYEYSQRNHDGAWLLIELAVQAKERIVLHRHELTLVGPDGRSYPVATQPEFLEDHQALTALLQNASMWRRPFDSYFRSRTVKSIRFFSVPGSVVSDSAISNLDEVASGDLLFKSPDARWSAGVYRLVLNHAQASAELPIRLQ